MTNTGHETGRLSDTIVRALAALEDSIAKRERVRCCPDECDWGVDHYDAQVSAARNELIAAVTTLAKQLHSYAEAGSRVPREHTPDADPGIRPAPARAHI